MSTRRLKFHALAASSLVALTVGAAVEARAQAVAPSSSKATEVEEMVVTGSRIANVGMRAPTPVTAVAIEELTVLSPTTLISAVSQLPQFYGNTNSDVRTGFFSSPGSGNLNLRGLNTGTSGRTLTLLDGRRVVPATGYGSVDINILPQALIKRIETVTGGASAAYGTDAVAGAVNFILDTNYTGWQVDAQVGATTHGDRANHLFSAAFGADLGDKAHLLLSAEYYHADRIARFDERDWYKGYSLINNPAAAVPGAPLSVPRYLLRANVVSSISTFGGLINSGVPTTSALYRRFFNPDGTLSPFVIGEGTTTQAHSITNGGSGDDTTADLQALAPEAERGSAFAYLDYDVTPNLNVYVQGLAGHSMIDQPDHGGRFAAVPGIDTRITIYRENAFLPAAVRQIMINENLASFQMNLTGDREGLGRESRVKQDNYTYSGTVGFKWQLPGGLLKDWQLEGYGQYGSADNKGYQQGILLDRISAAVDAVVDPGTGKTVCRAALQNPGKWGGCVPINLFGRGAPSDEAIAYVTRFTPGQQITSPLFYQPDGYASGETVTFTSGLGKVYNTRTTQKVADLTLSGKVWNGWAGPVVAAFGASYRKEEIDQIVYDPSNPASDPGIFPAAGDPALRGVPPYTASRSSMIQNSTVANVHGSYDVKEAFTEWQVPLLTDFPGVDSLTLLGSARYADYQGSGGVWSWKTGLDWQVFNDLRLRGTVSRDLRAATLLERYNQTGGVGTVTKDPEFPNDGTQTFSSRTGGNAGLDPETSTTYTYGVVYQPSWLTGLSASVDYWDVDIAGAIGLLGFQRIVDDCFAAPSSSVCGLITRDPTTKRLVQVRNITQNIAAAAGRGVDVEVNYRRALSLFTDGRESLGVRVFWSHMIENSSTTDRAVPATYFDFAGQTGVGNLPEDSVTATQSYTLGGFNLAVSERFISSGILNKRYNLPGVRVDVLDNTVPSVLYVNLAGSYSWNVAGKGTVQLYANVQNLFDKDPPVVPAVFDASLAQTGSQVNQGLFDLLGRRFTVGVKFRH